MIKIHTSTRYQGFALLLGAISLVAVACSDDDDDSTGNVAGGGSTAGKGGSSTAGKGGNSTAGKPNGGTSGGGKGGTPNGGNTVGGEAMGGEPTGTSGEGPGPIGGEGGGGGVGAGGESVGGAAMGGEGGAPEIVADTLDDGGFDKYAGDWKEEGDASAGDFKWIADNQPGLNHWAAGAYSISTWQTVSPLPNGTYKFSMEVEHGTLVDQYLFAKGCTEGEPDGVVKESTMSAGASGLTKFELTVNVTSGSCTVGIHSEGPDTVATDDGWANMDNAAFVAAP